MNKHLIVSLFLSCITWIFSYGEEDILSLMRKYEEKTELSERTKKESLGHLIIFTRKDLEIMQANTLGDVLRLIPLVNFIPNKFGVESVFNPGSMPTIPFYMRLYIDDHEVSSIHTYSPFLTYDRYSLENINHIEVYFSAGAIAVSNEPSQIIIRMYTKVPERENLSKIRVYAGSKKSYYMGFSSAYNINSNSSLFVSAGKSYLRFPRPEIRRNKLNRNQFRKNLFVKYRYYDTYIDFSAVEVKRGGFSGFSFDASPEYQNIYSLDTFLSITHNFDKHSKLTLSYDYQKRSLKEINKREDGGIFIPGLYNFLNPPILYHENLDFHKIAASYDVKIKNSRNSMLVGSFFRYYKQSVIENDIVDSTGKSSIKDIFFRVKNFYIGSAYVENSYNLNSRNLIMAGLRYDKYKFYGQKSKDKFNLRAGFISLPDDKFTIKSFVSHYEILPSMLLVEFSENKKLDTVKASAFSLEGKLKSCDYELKLFFSYYRISDIISFDKTKGYVANLDRSLNLHQYGIFYKKSFSPLLSVEVNYWITDVGKNQFSPDRGGYIKLKKEFSNNFKIYFDVVYRGSFKPGGLDVPASYDLKVALGYQLSDEWNVKVLGENILNSSPKSIYFNNFGERGYFDAVYRRIIITLEKVF